MHVVYVTREMVPSLRCGGIGSYAWDMACQLVQRDHAATIVCASDDTRQSSDALTPQGVRVIRLPGGDFAIPGIEAAGTTPITRRLRTITRFTAYRKMVADCLDGLIDRDGAEVVEFAEYGNEAAEWMHRRRRIPMVVRIHGPASRCGGERLAWRPWSWLKYRRAFDEYEAVRRADVVTCPSAAMAELVRRDGRLEGLPIEIIPNPVSARFWAAASQDAHFGERGSGATIFTASTVVAPKGIGELVEAVAIVRSRGYTVRLVIAGKWGRLGHELNQQLASDPQMAGWLTLLGQVPREKLREYYGAADVVCFPSWWENCPCACLEAMASGALVIGSTAGGMPEIVREGRDGLLAPARDSAGLAQRLMHVLRLPECEQRRIRDSARSRIEAAFDVNIVVPRMLGCYQHAIDVVAKRGSGEKRQCA